MVRRRGRKCRKDAVVLRIFLLLRFEILETDAAEEEAEAAALLQPQQAASDLSWCLVCGLASSLQGTALGEHRADRGLGGNGRSWVGGSATFGQGMIGGLESMQVGELAWSCLVAQVQDREWWWCEPPTMSGWGAGCLATVPCEAKTMEKWRMRGALRASGLESCQKILLQKIYWFFVLKPGGVSVDVRG